MMQRRFAILILAVLLPLSACGSSPEGAPDPDAETTDSPTPAADRDAAPQVPERPRSGDYVYEFIGLGTTSVPNGTVLTDAIATSGNDMAITVTNSRNDNVRRIGRRWEEGRVVELSNETVIGGNRRACSYDPPIEIMHIPIRVEEFREQESGGPGCEATNAINVVGREDTEDATGKMWSTWVIERQILSGDRTDEEKHWFSPDLGHDIRVETVTETGGRRTETAQLLRSYPSG
jgi:hypothetical protein